MKNKILSLILALSCFTAVAQTTNNIPQSIATPPSFLSMDFLTNLPTATNFQTAKIGIGIGVLERSGEFENFIKADLYVKTNWLFSAEIQNSPSDTIVDSFALYGGYRKAWPNAELAIELGPRKTFTTDATGTHPNWQGVMLLDAAWLPMTGGKFMLTAGLEFATSQRGNIFNERPSMAVRIGTKLLF